jgi:hypothetical protein
MTPWFQRIAQRPRDHSEAHCWDTNFVRSNFFLEDFLFKIRKVPFFKIPFRGTWFRKKYLENADIQFIRKLILRVGDVHIWLVKHENISFRLSWPLPERPKTRCFAVFYSPDFGGWSKNLKIEVWCGQIKWCDCCIDLGTAIPNDSLVVTQFIEIMELLRVQGPKNNI